MLEIRYVWEWPVRITHWINALCIVVLAVTGIYIGNPFLLAPSPDAFVMGWVRFIHYVFAYLFTVSMVARIIWLFIGNQHASWKAFVPWAFSKGRENMWGTFKYYTFIEKKVPYVVGHNALAAAAYSLVFALFLVQIVTGFALYGQYQPGSFWDVIFGPLFGLFSSPGVRLTHHVVTWLLIGFAIHHIYSAWLMDIKEKNGTLSSIFSGYKFMNPEDLK